MGRKLKMDAEGRLQNTPDIVTIFLSRYQRTLRRHHPRPRQLRRGDGLHHKLVMSMRPCSFNTIAYPRAPAVPLWARRRGQIPQRHGCPVKGPSSVARP